MQQFDAASVAALQTAVAARCISFALTARSTSQPYIDHFLGPYVRPRGRAPYLLLTVTAVYRTPDRVMIDAQGMPPARVTYPGVQEQFGPGGCQIVCDASGQTVATGLLLQWINAQFDLFNFRNPPTLVPARVP